MKSVVYFTVAVEITHGQAFSSTENMLKKIDGDMMFQFISCDAAQNWRVTKQEITKRSIIRINEGAQLSLFERS